MTGDPTNVAVRPRPVRIAFLVDLDEASHAILDELFQYCFSLWCGRFSLIVPCKDNKPLPYYLPWLKAFDADIIYSYINLTREDQLSFHEEFYPSVLQKHWTPPGDSPTRHAPQPSIAPLLVSSLIPLAGAASIMDGSRGVAIVTAMGALCNDRFLRDSFGIVSPQLRNALRGPLSNFGTIVAAVRDNHLQPREQHFQPPETTVPSDTAILYQMARNRRVRGLSRLSAMMAHRLDFHASKWLRSFNIVVGNTVSDRIMYWNARSLMPVGRDWDDVDLIIPREKFESPEFISHLREFLNHRSHIGGGNGPARATLRSISLSDVELERLASTMMNGQGWIAYDHHHVSNLSDVTPTKEELKFARLTGEQYAFRNSSQWIDQSATGTSIHLGAVSPDHIRHIPPSIANSDLGGWALDVDIERAINHSPYSNLTHRWRLPRRLRVTGAFRKPYQLQETYGPVFNPRTSSEGLLTVFGAIGRPPPMITIPSDEVAILHALHNGRDWPSFDRFGEDGTPPDRICARAERSASGRYFWGVYQLFGDLNTARLFLLHAFWRKQLQHLGATDQRTEERQNRVESQIRKRLGAKSFDCSDTQKLSALTNIVLQEADAERAVIRSLQWDSLRSDFSEMVAAYKSRYPSPQESADELDEDKLFERSLRAFVQDLCVAGVFHQGYEHTCRQCLHRSWTAISDLKSQIVCEVCHSEQPAPVDRAWQFRLNGFLREALQRHGIGPLFWAINHYCQNSSSSFWFEGPINIYFDDQSAIYNRPNTDIDLTIIDGGVVRMCEVKQSERQFGDPEGLAATMLKLRPDIAMIAVMEPESEKLTRKFKRFAKALEGSGIKPEMLTLDGERDFEDTPYF